MQGVQILVLYGPNGHGKTSFFDAIEWGLTGEIHRYSEPSDERNRSRFVRNHFAPTLPEVTLELLLGSGERIKVIRKGTAGGLSRTDYGKNKTLLKIVYEDEKVVLEPQSERLLESFLIREGWRDKITVMGGLNLTHLLGQEKMSRFLRGMKESERYDAISSLFGTQAFMRYKGVFEQWVKDLKEKSSMLLGQVAEVGDSLTRIQQELVHQESKVLTEEVDDRELFHSYIDLFKLPLDLYEDRKWNELHSIAVRCQQELRDARLSMEYGPIRNLAMADSMFSSWRSRIITHEETHKRLKELKRVSNLLERQKFLEELLDGFAEYFKQEGSKVHWEKDIAVSSERLQKSEMRADALRSFANAVMTSLQVADDQENYSALVSSISQISLHDRESKDRLIGVLLNFVAVRDSWLKASAVLETSDEVLQRLESEAKTFQLLNDRYLNLLRAVQEYASQNKEMDACPACGTAGITSEHLLQHVEFERDKVHPQLSVLELGIHKARELVLQQSEDLHALKNRVEKARSEVERQLEELAKKASSEQEKRMRFREQVEYLETELANLNRSRERYQRQAKNIGMDVSDADFHRGLLKESMGLKLQLGSYSFEDQKDVRYQIEMCQELIMQAEMEDAKFFKTLELLGPPLEEVKYWSVKQLETFLHALRDQQTTEVEELEQKEKLNALVRSILEELLDGGRLQSLRKEQLVLNEHYKKLQDEIGQIELDLSVAQEAMGNVQVAVDGLNESVMEQLFETVQTIFARINSHPMYRKLEFTKDRRFQNYKLLMQVLAGDQVANPAYIFSAAQINSIALAVFLAMSIQQQWSPLKLMALDDPVQSMDELNVLGLVDFIRVLSNQSGHDKQIIISTHDATFYRIMLKKFRYQHVGVIEYEGYGKEGPMIKQPFDEQGEPMKDERGEPIYVQNFLPLVTEGLPSLLLEVDRSPSQESEMRTRLPEVHPE
nr:hypothetical protein [Tumebacillus amylolyticus]